MSEENICEKHHKKLINKTALKVGKILLRCADCKVLILQEKICEKHNKHFEEWRDLQVKYFKSTCKDCEEA